MRDLCSIMIITVVVRNSSGFESEPFEFKISDNGALETIVRATRGLGLYNPSPVGTEDASVIGFGFYGHHKKMVRDHGKIIYDSVSIIYDHKEGSKVRDFADFASVIGELLKI